MAKLLKKLTRSQERFYAIRADFEEVEIERDCEGGQVRLRRMSEDRWRSPAELIEHLTWCIEQIGKLPPIEK